MSQVQTRAEPVQASRPATSARTNRMAVWALVLAVLTLGGIGSVLGIVLGVKARHQTERNGEGGHGLATAAVVVGVLTTLVAIAYWIVIARHFGGSSGGSGGGGGTGGSGGGGGAY